ncbi:MAG: peptidase D-aminopeptidase, partial [Desulfacinum sp.]|nr:peptidase D-aminopeptidase [Desulfacinum sp.]
MKVFISVDIEGIGCVVRSEHSSPQGREFQWARKRMTEEVNAATAGAFAAGASEVVVADSHNVGLNLLADELDPRVRLVMGSPRPLSMMEGVQLGFDAVFLV